MSGIYLKAESGLIIILLSSTRVNFFEIIPSYYCYSRFFNSADVDCNYYTPPVMQPIPDEVVKACEYLGNRTLGRMLSRCPGVKFRIMDPFAVDPSIINPDLLETKTFSSSPLDVPPPIIIIAKQLLNIHIIYCSIYLMKKVGGAPVVSNNLTITKSIKFSAKQYERPGLSQDEVTQIKQAFDLFDPDGHGSVNPRDLKAALDSLGFEAQNQTIYQMISDLDADGSGNIGFEDFLHLMTSRVSDKDSRQNIRKVFNLFDDEKTGFITIKSLRRIVRELGQNIEEHELQQMIDKADSDHDGMISEEQFYMIITKKGGAH